MRPHLIPACPGAVLKINPKKQPVASIPAEAPKPEGKFEDFCPIDEERRLQSL
jgi:hypothetical protein